MEVDTFTKMKVDSIKKKWINNIEENIIIYCKNKKIEFNCNLQQDNLLEIIKELKEIIYFDETLERDIFTLMKSRRITSFYY